MPDMPAIAVLGRKLDSIPFSPYHIAVILVLGLVGFTDGYDLALTGSLLVLAKGPLHITPDQIRLLTVAATMFVVTGFPATIAGSQQNFTVTARDAYGNTDTNYQGTVSFSSSAAGLFQSMRCSSRKPMSNQAASRPRKSASRAASSLSSRRTFSRKPRRSTRNLRPSGIVVN